MSESLLAHAILGRDAEEFLNSELGQYLVGVAEQEEQQALEQLATVFVWRRNRIRQLQNEVWRARSVRQWLAEIVQAGKQAERGLEESIDD